MEPACECNSVWFQDVATVDGSPISAMAYPSYPSEGFASPTLSQFFGPLASSSNLTASYQKVRADITGLCTTCATMPIFVNEYNAGPGAAPSSLGGSYANAVFLAASVTQALRANVSQLTIFNLQTGSATAGYALLSASSAPETTGTLFSQVLSHLAVGTVLGGGVHSSLPDAWSVVTRNASAESLLVANTNLTNSVNVSTAGSFLAAAAGASYQWSPSMNRPTASIGPLAGSYTVAAQGILLLTILPHSVGLGGGPVPRQTLPSSSLTYIPNGNSVHLAPPPGFPGAGNRAVVAPSTLGRLDRGSDTPVARLAV